ncbi:hypothetical protein RHSIM_Rhsim07G0121000 [Rhododendron simsii]|uniref:Uncharacterized protein n=1 Tax=Rhododendron simsii TaxID=118357 RepID=A0A834GW18_RHOSS|nr:hypothetical protein RHSIM_Rhsim07G0121000 [Rhododendron simsii]
MGMIEIEVAGEKLVIHEFDDVYDSVTGRALTGSWLWDSALLLSHWMMIAQGRVEFDFVGKNVIELGAGTGLPGLTAARLGASRVILTDVEPLLPGLKNNVEANGLGDRVEVSRLIWGSDELPSQLGDLGGVDLVLMSDVFFDVAETAALGKTLKRICGEKTVVWAACEVRPWTGDCLNQLVSHGFELVELPSQLSADYGNFSVFRLVQPTQGFESEKEWSMPLLNC